MKFAFVLAALVASVAAQSDAEKAAAAKKCIDACKLTDCKSDDQYCLCTNKKAQDALQACVLGGGSADAKEACTPIIPQLLEFQSSKCPDIIKAGPGGSGSSSSATATATDGASEATPTDATGSGNATATETDTESATETATPDEGTSTNGTTSTNETSTETGTSSATGTAGGEPTQATGAAGRLAVGSAAGVIAVAAALFL